jgi:hypothetical protein
MANVVADHAGDHYGSILERMHIALRPNNYLEIGVFTGQTLSYARCRAIAIDPDFKFEEGEYVKQATNKPSLFLFRTGSDEFFANQSPTAIFGQPLDMAFLDGMHRCEYLLRDFFNTERHCRRNSVIGLHDCLPLELPMTSRIMGAEASVEPHRSAWWTGDVWRTALLLRRRRPDLEFTVVDAAPTGLVLITNLDPENTSLSDDYRGCVKQMMSWDLGEIGIQNFFDEMHLEPTKVLSTEEAITSRFWF